MAMILRQNTAVDVLVGPFLDKSDGSAAETGESPSVKLSKNGQTLAAKNDATTPAHDADGYYNCELDATDTNTVGTLVLTVAASANALPVRHEFQVVEEATYDFLYASGATPIADINAECDTALTDYDPPTKTEMDSAFTEIKGATWASGTDTLEAIRDRGDSAWVTATTVDLNADQSGVTVGTVNALGAQAKLDVNAEADTALTDYDPPTKAELDSAFTEIKGATWAAGTDTLEAIRDRGDAAWTTADTSGLSTFDPGTDTVTVGTNNDKTGYSISGSITTLDGLNDLDAAGVRSAVGLSSANLDTQLSTIDTNVDDLEKGIIFGTAQTGTLSTTQATSDLTGYEDDQLIGRVIIWTSGACDGEATDITDYANASGLLTFTALTTAPGNGDTFKIV